MLYLCKKEKLRHVNSKVFMVLSAGCLTDALVYLGHWMQFNYRIWSPLLSLKT